MVGWHHQLDGHEFEQAPAMVKDREARQARVHGGRKEYTERPLDSSVRRAQEPIRLQFRLLHLLGTEHMLQSIIVTKSICSSYRRPGEFLGIIKIPGWKKCAKDGNRGSTEGEIQMTLQHKKNA